MIEYDINDLKCPNSILFKNSLGNKRRNSKSVCQNVYSFQESMLEHFFQYFNILAIRILFYLPNWMWEISSCSNMPISIFSES